MNHLMLNKKKCLFCNSTKTPLFVLPKDIDRLLVWLKILRMTNLLQYHSQQYIRNNGRLCQIHFGDASFTSTFRKKLLKFAIPICPFLRTSMCEIPDKANVTHDSFKEGNLDECNKSFQENKGFYQNLNKSFSSENLEFSRIEFNDAFVHQSQESQLRPIQSTSMCKIPDRANIIHDSFKEEVIDQSNESFQENKGLYQNLNKSFSSENLHSSLELARIEFNDSFVHRSQEPQLKPIHVIEEKIDFKDDCKIEVIEFGDTQEIGHGVQQCSEKDSNTDNLNTESLRELFRTIKAATDIIAKKDPFVERRVKALHDIHNALNPYYKLFETFNKTGIKSNAQKLSLYL